MHYIAIKITQGPSELPEDDPRGSKHVGANIVI